uniref:Ig-like domain-containing protein n=1 Tax=Anopheles atroparvus TaxID=41427 RepID=A0A182JCA1_ANOAO
MTGRRERRSRSKKNQPEPEPVQVEVTPAEPTMLDLLKIPGRGDSPRDFRSLHREKSPFEIGERPEKQVASQKAIIDKALVMDISGGVTNVDEYISLFFTDSCSLDPASCGDISTVKVVVVEEEIPEQEPPKPADEHGKTEAEVAAELARIKEEEEQAQAKEPTPPPAPEPEPEPEPEPQQQQQAEAEAKPAPVKSREASRRTSTASEMTERERDLEWQRQRQMMRPPLVISHLKARAAPKGSTVKLTCTISGPGITVRWLKNGNPIEKSSKHTFKVSEGLLGLEIKDVDTVDAGEYCCMIKNKNGETSTSTTLTVYENFETKPTPPTFISIKEATDEPGGVAPSVVAEAVAPPEAQAQEAATVEPVETATATVDAPPASVDAVSPADTTAPVPADAVAGLPPSGAPEKPPSPEKLPTESAPVADAVAAEPAVQEAAPAVPEAAPVAAEAAPVAAEAAPAEGEEGEPAVVTAPPEVGGHDKHRRLAPEKSPSPPPIGGDMARYHHKKILHHRDKLQWSVHLTNRALVAGHRLKLMCAATGFEPTLEWFKDGQPVEYDDHIVDMNDMHRAAYGCLWVNDVTMKDAGEYKCVAKNGLEEIETVCKLTVVEPVSTVQTFPPMFVRMVRENYDPYSNILTVEFVIRANPTPTLTWYKGIIKLGVYPDSHMRISQHFDETAEHTIASLVFYDPSYTDSGEYICIASNSVGEATCKHNLDFCSKEQYFEWLAKKRPGWFKAESYIAVDPVPVFDDGEQEEGGEEEQEEEEGEGEGDGEQGQEGVEKKPKVKRAPKLPDVKELPEEEIKAEAEAKVVRVVSPEHPAAPEGEAGPPKATEPEAEPEPRYKRRKSRTQVALEEFERRKKFDFVSHMANVRVEPGKTLRLIAYVKCPEEVTSFWKRDGRVLGNGLRLTHTTMRCGTCVMEIEKCKYRDAGTYTCVAKCPTYGEIEQSCTVSVVEKTEIKGEAPVFTRPMKETYDPIQDELTLECCVRGDPEPETVWIVHGVFMRHNTGGRLYFRKYSDGRQQLKIFQPSKEDSGRYVCRAKNSVDKTDMVYYLNYKNSDEDVLKVFEDELHKKTEKPILSRHLRPKDCDYNPEDEALIKWSESRSQHDKDYDFRYKLKFVTQLQDKTVPEGSNLKFTCYVDGKFPLFMWFKDEIPLVQGRKYRQKTRRDGKVTLEIVNVTTEDAGTYKLEARNYAGSIETKSVVSVYENPYTKFVPPIFASNILEYQQASTSRPISHYAEKPCPTNSTAGAHHYQRSSVLRASSSSSYDHTTVSEYSRRQPEQRESTVRRHVAAEQLRAPRATASRYSASSSYYTSQYGESSGLREATSAAESVRRQRRSYYHERLSAASSDYRGATTRREWTLVELRKSPSAPERVGSAAERGEWREWSRKRTSPAVPGDAMDESGGSGKHTVSKTVQVSSSTTDSSSSRTETTTTLRVSEQGAFRKASPRPGTDQPSQTSSQSQSEHTVETDRLSASNRRSQTFPYHYRMDTFATPVRYESLASLEMYQPIVQTVLRDRMVKRGSNLILVCSFWGVNCEVEWVHNYARISNSAKYRVSFHQGMSILEIYDISRQEAGMYKCIVRNDCGEDVTNCCILVLDHIRLTSSTTGRTRPERHSLTRRY